MVCDALGSCYHLSETILSEVSSHAPGTFGAGSTRYARLYLVQHNQKLTLASWLLRFLVPWWTLVGVGRSLLWRDTPGGIIKVVREDVPRARK